MPATPTQARDQMLSLLKAAVDASTQPTLVLIWDDVADNVQPPAPPLPWARVKVRHSVGRATSISGANGKRRYTRGGVVVVQLFAIGGKGLTVSDEIVSIILAAYEGKTTSGGVIFRNGRFQEVGQDGPWFQTNVFADFEYEEYK